MFYFARRVLLTVASDVDVVEMETLVDTGGGWTLFHSASDVGRAQGPLYSDVSGGVWQASTAHVDERVRARVAQLAAENTRPAQLHVGPYTRDDVTDAAPVVTARQAVFRPSLPAVRAIQQSYAVCKKYILFSVSYGTNYATENTSRVYMFTKNNITSPRI